MTTDGADVGASVWLPADGTCELFVVEGIGLMLGAIDGETDVSVLFPFPLFVSTVG